MTQIATVAEVPAPGLAVVRVKRETACGHDCENCGGCGAQGGILTVTAGCDIDVKVGDLVELSSGNRVLAIAAVVYLLPLVLFLLGYMVPAGLAEPVRYLCGGVGFILGGLVAVVCDRTVRRKKAVSYQILRRL